MIEQRVGAFTRVVKFLPGYDHRADPPRRNFGICSMRMAFLLIGPRGAVQWIASTGWYPKSARHGQSMSMMFNNGGPKPDGWNLGYHAKTPQYEGHEPVDCELLPEGKCYFDGSTLSAEELEEGFITGGDDWIWNRLEAYYAFVFENAEYPNFDPIIAPHPDEAKQ